MSAGPQPSYAGLPRIIAVYVFAFMAVAPPLAVWSLESERTVQSLETETRILAVTVSRVVARYPDYWDLTPERLAYVVRDVMPQGRHLVIANQDRRVVLAVGAQPQSPVMSSSQRLFDRDVAVGTLTLQGSLSNVLVDTVVTAIVSLALSLLATLLLWRRVLLVIRQAALHVQEARERFKRLTELSNDGYWTMDAGLRFTALSGGMERIGLGMETAGNRPVQDVPFTGNPESNLRLLKALQDREPFHNLLVCVGSGERAHWILLSGEPLYDQSGEFLGYHGTATDVSERMRMEEALIQSEKLASVGQLAAGMAHEINNPLGGILQSVQVIRRRLDPALQPNLEAARTNGCTLDAIQGYLEERRILEMLDNIDGAGRKAAGVISIMLEFSRKSSEYMTQEDVVSLLNNAVELSGKHFPQSGELSFSNVEVVKDYQDDAIFVSCSRTELEQVLVNIMKNAVQAMHAKEYANGEKPRLALRAFQRDGSAFLEIGDNGPGMDAAVRKHVFDPFFTTKSPGEGTGLGLSVSYYIVTHNHGGSIEVESTPGVGTTFTVRIPLSPQ